MSAGFLIRPASPPDSAALYRLSSTLAVRGFLTLPTSRAEWIRLIDLSQDSFAGKSPQGHYGFVLEDTASHRLIGSSLLIARHGTPSFPHLALVVDETEQRLTLSVDGKGMSELGGLILEPDFRGHPLKLGKALSLARFAYLRRHAERFSPRLIAEFLPPFLPEGRAPLWEALGQKLTGLSYREADERSRTDKSFFTSVFPHHPIPFADLSSEARAVIGRVGPETEPAVSIVTSLGLKYLHEVDPFDGGPHYGAEVQDIRFEVAEKFFEQTPEVACPLLRS